MTSLRLLGLESCLYVSHPDYASSCQKVLIMKFIFYVNNQQNSSDCFFDNLKLGEQLLLLAFF